MRTHVAYIGRCPKCDEVICHYPKGYDGEIYKYVCVEHKPIALVMLQRYEVWGPDHSSMNGLRIAAIEIFKQHEQGCELVLGENKP